MLHEILLSLSGVPSPIWSQVRSNIGKEEDHDVRDYISPPEQAMLAELSQLSELHSELKKYTSVISRRHRSSVCRAVSSAISDTHLSNFRKHIVTAEASVLQKNAAYVGDYQIVPLSTIAAEFVPWTRRLEWLLKVTNQMRRKIESKDQSEVCSSARILRILERESHTGFTDIKDIAVDLLKVAQMTWMRSLSSWLLFGRIPDFGQDDFMIQKSIELNSAHLHRLEDDLVPDCVTESCAEDILAIGNALNQVQAQNIYMTSVIMELVPHNMEQIRRLSYPLSPSVLETSMASINRSISRNALSQLIPKYEILEISRVIRDYLLLGRGEFAIALIANVDHRLSVRESSQSSARPIRKLGHLEEMPVKNSELNAVLAKTWSDLASLQGDHESEEGVYLAAKQYLRFRLFNHIKGEDAPILATLLPSPATMCLELPRTSSLRIFFSEPDLIKYSEINAYLLSLRRAEIRLAELWKLTSHRRCHPAPLAPPMSATVAGRKACQQRRQREDLRTVQTRRHWSSVSKALFLVNEFGAYLHGEVVHSSWQQFYTWLTRGQESRTEPTETITMSIDSSYQSPPMTVSIPRTSPTGLGNSSNKSRSPEDPRIMAQAHQCYLEALYGGLLLGNHSMTQSLKTFFHMIDHIVALFKRLQAVWQGLDLQEDDGVMDAFTNHAKDEKDVSDEMDRSRENLENTIHTLVEDIKSIEREKEVNDFSNGISTAKVGSGSPEGNFIPWRPRTLDRLIMKLDFLQGDQAKDSDGMAELQDE